MVQRDRIVVVGGGITGAFAAYILARRGHEVTLVERDVLAAGASGRNPGGLNPLHGPGIPGPLAELALTAHRLHLEAWPEIAQRSRVDFFPRRRARIQLAFDEAEREALNQRAELYHIAGFSARSLTSAELAALRPCVGEAVIAAVKTGGDAQVDPGRYTRALAAAAESLGVRIVIGRAHELVGHDGRALAVRLAERDLPCEGVVLATGPWSELVELPTSVRPVKGELLLVEPDEAVASEIAWRKFGVYPTADGRVWLGGTEEEAGFDDRPSSEARETILRAARQMVPTVASAPVVGHVAGLRPVTADDRPVIGRPFGWENVWVANGGGRKGMLLAAALGTAAAELVSTGATAVPIGPCALDRVPVAA